MTAIVGHTPRNKGFPAKFENVEPFPGRMAKAVGWPALNGLSRPEKPWLDGLPRLIFVSDMSDALSKAIDFDYLRSEIIDLVSSPNGLRHRWLWLTKLPGRMAEFSESLGRTWPANLWVGTSITTRASAGRIDDLLNVGDEHTTRFLSVEPQWEALDLRNWLPKLDWLVQAGESGDEPDESVDMSCAEAKAQYAREFKLEWAYDLQQQCQEAGVPYFLKQLGTRATFRGRRWPTTDDHGGDWSEWPEELRTRQMPNTASKGVAVGRAAPAV